MAVLVGSKHLARIQGDDAPGRVKVVLLSLPEGDDNASTDARPTMDALDLEPVVEAQSGGQQLVIASAQSPSQAGVDVIVEIVQDYGWRLLAGGKPRLRALRWPRLLEYLLGGLDGQPVLTPTSTWDQAKQSLLSSAAARALAGALLRCHETRNDVWQVLWSQRCEGGRVPSQSILPLVCSGCGDTAPVWVHQCASTRLCGSCRERAGTRWPKATWALRHSGQLSSSAWRAIQRDLRGVQVDGVRCPDDPTAALPLLLWWAALDGDSRVLWLWHHRGVL